MDYRRLLVSFGAHGRPGESDQVIKRPARKLAEDHPDLTLASSVSCACSSHNNGFKTGGHPPVQWAQTMRENGFTTRMPSKIETLQMAAMGWYLQEQTRDAISRAEQTTRKETIDVSPGTWVMYFRRGKVTRGGTWALVEALNGADNKK